MYLPCVSYLLSEAFKACSKLTEMIVQRLVFFVFGVLNKKVNKSFGYSETQVSWHFKGYQ